MTDPFLPADAIPAGAVLLDCRFRLDAPDAGAAAYRAGHLPGARYVHLDRDLSGPPSTASEGRHPLPDRTAWRGTVGRLGIRQRTPVVAYDDQNGLMAARAWWLLRWLGHEPVWILRGGLGAWTGPLETDDTPPDPAPPYPNGTPAVRAVDALTTAERLQAGAPVLDARAPERYRGEVEPIDPVAGHLPGARNLPVGDLFDTRGAPLAPAAVRARAGPLVPGGGTADAVPVTAYCGSGVTACALIAVLAHGGVEGVDLYAGSFSDWIAKDQPVATGP